MPVAPDPARARTAADPDPASVGRAAAAPGAAAPGAAAHPAFGRTDALLLLMALIWGINFSVVKFGSQRLDPLAYNGIRVSLAAACLVAIAAATRERWPRGRDLWVLAALGLLGNGLYQVFFIEGIARTRAGTAALVLAAGPAFIALFGRLFGTERIRARGWAGITLSIAGVGLVLFGNARGAADASNSLLGALLVLGGGLCWAAYTVMLQPYTHRVGGLALSAVTMTAGAIPLVALSVPGLARTDFAAVPASAWLAVAYSGLLALVVAYLIWYRGVKVLGPTRTAMYANLQPAIALVVAWLTLGEIPTASQLVGMALIFGGILLTRS